MNTELNEEIVRKELADLSASRALQRSPQLQRMLDYLVSETLAGRGDRIKAFNIAIDVLGRKNSFDASTDPIVRVQAGRLRSALTDHYANEGRSSACRIELPKGGYVPTFILHDRDDGHTIVNVSAGQPVDDPGDTGADNPAAAVSAEDRLAQVFKPAYLFTAAVCFIAAVCLFALVAFVSFVISYNSHREAANVYRLMLIPFAASSESIEEKNVAHALDVELATSLTLLSLVDLQLAAQSLTAQPDQIVEAAKRVNAHWAVTGVLHRTETGQKVSVFLLDATTGSAVWSHSYETDIKAADVANLSESVILDLQPRLYAAAKRAIERKSSPDALDLFVLATWTPGAETNTEAWQLQRLDLARRAVAADETFGPAYSVIADKLSILANINPRFDTEVMRAEASEAAREALILAPNNSEVTFNLALYHLHAGRLEQSLRFVHRTLEVAPRHSLALFWNDVLPYYCEPSSKEIIDKLVNFDRRLSPANPVRWQTELWRARLLFNGGNYKAAIDAAGNSMRITPNLYASLVALTSLVAVGQVSEALAIYRDLKRFWPGFSFKHHNEVHLKRVCGSSPQHINLLSVYRRAAETMGAASD